MFSVETQVGIGMKDLGYGEPLLRDTLEKLPRIPAPLAVRYPTSQPEEPEYVGAFRAYRGAVAPRTQDPSSLSPLAFRRYTSAVRAGCANERQSGSVRGALGNRRPYRDLTKRFNPTIPFDTQALTTG